MLCVLLAGNASATDYQLPFNGRWFVAQGGDTLNVNHHADSSSQAFGIDFSRVGGKYRRELFRTDGARNDDFYAWSEPVLAPVNGEIIDVVDGFPDNDPGVRDEENAAGNHVTIRTDDNLYVFLAHFRRDSITVRPGEKVRQGQQLGACGNSGNSSYPHIHMHVQDDEAFGRGVGRNVAFGPINVEMSGKEFGNVTWPLIRGLFVSN